MAGSSPSWSLQIDQLGSETAGSSPSWPVQIDNLGTQTAGSSPSWIITLTSPSQIDLIRTRHIRGLVGLGDWPQRIASTGGIIFNSVAGTLMFTVLSDPSILGYYFTDAIIRADLVSAVTTPPTVAFGTTNGGSDIIAPVVLTGLTAQNKCYSIRSMGSAPFLTVGTNIYFNVTVAGTSTQLMGQVEILGFPVVS